MAIIYDLAGNPMRVLAAQGGDTLTDTRPAATLSTLNADTTIDIIQESNAIVDIRGTFVATFIAEISFDGTNYAQYPIWSPSSEIYVPTISTTGQFSFSIPPGSKKIRIRCNAYTSGSATIVLRAANQLNFVITRPIPSSMSTQTGAAGAAVTLTIPAAGAGLFNYLTNLRVSRYASAALTASGTPIIVTTTGVSGNPAFTIPTEAAGQGNVFILTFDFGNVIKGSAANTAITVICPATTNVIWRINAASYVGA